MAIIFFVYLGMDTWNKLIIDVDYSPSDPGCSRWFCDKTSFAKEDLTIGQKLSYEDSGGLFSSIILKEMTDEGVVVEYAGTDYSVQKGKTARLDSGGRNYTNFYLHVYLK